MSEQDLKALANRMSEISTQRLILTAEDRIEMKRAANALECLSTEQPGTCQSALALLEDFVEFHSAHRNGSLNFFYQKMDQIAKAASDLLAEPEPASTKDGAQLSEEASK